METEEVREKLIDVLRRFDTAMVTTTAANGTIHARPMAIAEIDPDGEVWFVTSKETDKVEEIRTDARAVVTVQTDGCYGSLSGLVDVIFDPERARALWRSSFDAWFPPGTRETDVVLLRLRPVIGEYWDVRSERGIRHVFKVLFESDGATPPAAAPEHHAKVVL